MRSRASPVPAWEIATDAHFSRPIVRAPSIEPPAPFVERRARHRREADQVAHRETLLLARSLDVLASDGEPGDRLVGLLRLLAATVGARRAAVLAGGSDRRIVADAAGSRGAGERLAAWLDARAPQTRASRAATGAAPVEVVGLRLPSADSGAARSVSPPVGEGESAPDEAFACVPVPSAGDVILGFTFDAPVDEDDLGRRLPPQLARHAAVALSLVTRELATAGELVELRAREEERSRFVSTVAHELRTPLTGLSGYLDLILDGKVDDPAVERDFLVRGQSIVGSMSELVGDLLDLSRLESGSLGLDVRAFSVAESITRVVEGLEPIALRRGIRLTTGLPPRLRAATGDRRRVEQVLTNLAANALKFAAPDSGVELAGWFDGAVAVIAVRDQGSGIAPTDRARIFERFYRMSGHERITGTGLGLPIARDLARAMGGDLDVASVPGSGSSFVLALPGPAKVDPDVVRAVLDRAVAAEEIRLEEAAVLRALQVAGHAVPRPRLVRMPEPVGGGAPRDEGLSRGASGTPRAARERSVRLRAIDGIGPRTVGRAPA
ncbi:MAG TPA: HAMP domain-containing sensor histidine kinase [Candidatus Limnocylindrales bacterium]|nr:HAMP domain-containing sensor histidine kinase [Candidatus Limnocylindrales bacterium]